MADLRRRALAAAGVLALLVPGKTVAQGRVRKMGILDGGRARPAKSYDFVRLLKHHGFEEGANLEVLVKSANFEYDDLDRLAQELVAQRPEVIVAMGPSSIAAAAGATKAVPIVMMHSGDPVALGLVPNLARPGGNITGNGWEQDVRQVAKTLGLLREVAPNARRLGLVWHVQNRSHPLYEERFRQAATDLGWEVASFGLRRGPQAEAKLRELEESPVQALVVINDYITIMYARQIDAIIKRRRLPALMSGRIPGLFDSAVLHYGPRLSEYPAVVAEYVARILNGAKPGDLPIVLPSRWEMAVNPRAAASIGVAIPDSLRLGADEVID